MKLEFEDILQDVGDYGRYQINMIMLFLVPAASLLPWFSMNIMFMLSVPDHWCYVPEVAASNLTLEQQRLLISPPSDAKCTMYDVNYTQLLLSNVFTVPNDTKTIPCNSGWRYDQTYYDYTAASQWDMVCEDSHYPSFIFTLYNVGSIVGTPIYGALSDKVGRKPVFFLTIIVTALTALASVFMTNFTAFIVLKSMNGSLMPSVFQLPYIIILEIVGPHVRTRMNGIVNCSWTIGLCFLTVIAYFSRNWFVLGLFTSSVTLLYFMYYKFLPESPRWLVSQERYSEAAKVLNKIGETNGMNQDKEILYVKLQKLGERSKKEKEVDGVSNTSTDLLRYPQLRKKFLIITFCWAADLTAYYGLQLNATNLAGNEFINFFLLSLFELPGGLSCWFFMDRFGRRWCAAGAFICVGIVCSLPAILPSDLPHVGVVSSMLGKYFGAAAFIATYQQSSELYPTTVRSVGMGMSSVIAGTVTLAVPYVVYLNIYGKSIPFIVIGATCFIAGILATFLPETLNENLPQTIFDAELFGKDQKYFSLNRKVLPPREVRKGSLKDMIIDHFKRPSLKETPKDMNLHNFTGVSN